MKNASVAAALEPLPFWGWGLLRPSLPLAFAWGVLSVCAAFAQPFSGQFPMGFGAALVYWPVIILARAICEVAVRGSMRERLDLPAWASVLVEPVLVSTMFAPLLLFIDSRFFETQSPDVLASLVRAYLVSQLISSWELVLHTNRIARIMDALSPSRPPVAQARPEPVHFAAR